MPEARRPGTPAWRFLKDGVDISLDLTLRCNLECRHCAVSAGPRARGELPIGLALGVLRDARDLGVGRVCFTGGEATLRRDLWRLAEYGRGLGLGLTLFTNGTTLDGAGIRTVSELFSRVAVSVDGPQSFHDWWRPRPGCFARAQRTIVALAERGVPVVVQLTVTARSLSFVEWVGEAAAGWGAELVSFAPLSSQGRAARLGPGFHLALAELDGLYARVLALRGRLLRRVRVELKAVKAKSVLLEHPCQAYACSGHACHSRSTGEPRELTVRADGTVLPLNADLHPRLALGNLTQAPLSELIASYVGSDRHRRLMALAERVWREDVRSWPHAVLPWMEILAGRSRSTRAEEAPAAVSKPEPAAGDGPGDRGPAP
ncbi:MAG: radical SAM protein [Acetobacteraceae bacterium]|nr:radical SAM protein [Acetobacteraceae bacterium]